MRRFQSAILPAVHTPLSEGYGGPATALYLHGLSSGDFRPALEESSLAPRRACRRPPLSASTSTVAGEAQGVHEARPLKERFRLRVGGGDPYQGQARPRRQALLSLVMVGAKIDGKKELVTVQEDGCWESEESWAELLRDLKKGEM